MTFWLIAIPAVVAVGALIWWSSGRARPDMRRRAVTDEVFRDQTKGGMYNGSLGGGMDIGGPGGI
jgi:hypothetical protein